MWRCCLTQARGPWSRHHKAEFSAKFRCRRAQIRAAGLAGVEAIQAATIVPARMLGLDKELGTVEVGKRVDLIVVNGNPLESIHDIRKVESVIAAGRLYKCAELWLMVGFQA
jgi:imidazolonepropionase-like amidohydrolase